MRYSEQTRTDISAALLEREHWPEGYSKQVWPVWHRTCREIAFFHSVKPTPDVTLESRYTYDYEGNHPEPGSPMVCCACKEGIKAIDLCAQRPGELLALPGVNPFKKVTQL